MSSIPKRDLEAGALSVIWKNVVMRMRSKRFQWGGNDQGERVFSLFQRDGFVWIAVGMDDQAEATGLFKVRKDLLEEALSGLP